MSLGSFILVQVGKAIIRIRPEKLGATLRRFKGAKEIKKPTDAQVDKSQTITKDLGNFNKADRKIVAKAMIELDLTCLKLKMEQAEALSQKL